MMGYHLIKKDSISILLIERVGGVIWPDILLLLQSNKIKVLPTFLVVKIRKMV